MTYRFRDSDRKRSSGLCGNKRGLFFLVVLVVFLATTIYLLALYSEISSEDRSIYQWIGRQEPAAAAAEVVVDSAGEDFFRLTTDIDFVYTWVNGSDPAHLENLKAYKQAHLRSDSERHEQFVQLQFDDFMSQVHWSNQSTSTENTTTTGTGSGLGEHGIKAVNDPRTVWPCYHKYCVQKNNMFIIQPQLGSDDKKSVASYVKKLKPGNEVHLVSLEEHRYLSDKGDKWHNVTLMVVDLDKAPGLEARLKVLDSLQKLFRATFMRRSAHRIYLAYFTADCTLSPNCLRNVDGAYMFRLGDGTAPSNAIKEASTVEADLPFFVTANIEYRIDYRHLPARYEGVVSDQATSNKDKAKTEKARKEMEKAESRLAVVKATKAELVEYLDEFIRARRQEEETDELNDETQAFAGDGFRYAETLSMFEQRVAKNQTTRSNDLDPSMRQFELYKANIAWDLGDPFYDDVAPNRFSDNDELRYSLRSVEQFAPWFRNLIIVTNGQVPAWLNRSHPRLRLVTHEQIFANKSHLPTFSSPAIEAHLHRIEGLSQRFVYFNDDVILGKRVWPDDFYTDSKGFKLYLAWQLPGCNPSCPNTWIKDGYCDKACNTLECEYDGGDCAKGSNSTGAGGSPGGSNTGGGGMAFIDQSHAAHYYCSPGCSTTWLADKYCDHACNTLNCSFDMGDCGLTQVRSQLKSLHLADLTATSPVKVNSTNRLRIAIDKDQEWSAHGFYLNMTGMLFEAQQQLDFKISDASYTDTSLIRTMSVLNSDHLLMVLTMPPRNSNNSSAGTTFEVELKGQQANSSTFELTLEIDLAAVSGLRWADHLDDTASTSTSDPQVSDEPAQQLFNFEHLDFEHLKPQVVKATDQPNQPADHEQQPVFKNNLFRLAYESYREYLNWCVRNDYLTSEGLAYKLDHFYRRLASDIGQSVDELAQKLKNIEWPLQDALASDDEDMSLVKLLFFDPSISPFGDIDREMLLKKFSEKANGADQSDRMKRLAEISFQKRKLLDTFADSLRHVNKIYNKVYGYVARKVPAHMPHLIDRSIMTHLQRRFPDEFERTSGNRMRTAGDMQYSFSYYYFVMGESRQFNASALFGEFDLNRNGLLDKSELNLIGMRLNSKPYSFLPQSSSMLRSLTQVDSDRQNMYKLNPELKLYLDECSNATDGGGQVNVESFSACEKLVEFLQDKFWPVRADSATSSLEYNFRKNKYKYELLDEEETKFLMIGANPYDVELKMNNLMREPVKFICLNDNIDAKAPSEAKKLRYLLKYFYRSLYPNKSSFELRDAPEVARVPASLFWSSSQWSPAHFHKHYREDPLIVLKLVIFILVVMVAALLVSCLFKRSKIEKNSRSRSNSGQQADHEQALSSAYLSSQPYSSSSSSIRLRPTAAPVFNSEGQRVGIQLANEDSPRPASAKKLKKPAVDTI